MIEAVSIPEQYFKVYSLDEFPEDKQSEIIDRIRDSRNADHILEAFYESERDFMIDWAIEEFKEIGVDLEPRHLGFHDERGAYFGIMYDAVPWEAFIEEDERFINYFKGQENVDAEVEVIWKPPKYIGIYSREFPTMETQTTESDAFDIWVRLMMDYVDPDVEEECWASVENEVIGIAEDIVGEKLDEICELCKKFYNHMFEMRDYVSSDDFYKTELIERGYGFLENGKLYDAGFFWEIA